VSDWGADWWRSHAVDDDVVDLLREGLYDLLARHAPPDPDAERLPAFPSAA
jgi:hypothetical protein